MAITSEVSGTFSLMFVLASDYEIPLAGYTVFMTDIYRRKASFSYASS